jgi:sulfotransferase
MQKYYFISGLPRSGSTLLSSILKQNPRFTANISDPLHDYARNILTTTHASVGMESAVPIPKRQELIKGLFSAFYQDGNEVCFNTNRAWTAQTSLLKDLFPYTKIIVCIRDVPWILDSFEQLNSKNPYTIKALYHHQDFGTVYHRANSLMDPNNGYVAGPLTCLKQSLFSNEKNMLCVVDYDALAKRPEDTLRKVYQFIDQPYYDHDFDDVEDSYDEFDEQTNIIGLHTVRKKVEYKQRKPIIPSDLWQQNSGHSFWKFDFDHIKKQILWID